MEYEAFKEAVLKGFKESCGGNMEIRTEKILKNNGKHYDGVRIIQDGAEVFPCPVLPLQWLYGAYRDGDISVAGCVRVIQEAGEEHRNMGGIAEMAQKATDWKQVKESVYPILLSTEGNGEMLGRVVSIPMLDLSVAYIYRGKIGRRCAAVKISPRMLEAYGISKEELHRQAVENLAGDGYCFRDIRRFIMEKAGGEACGPDWQEGHKGTGVCYILTNADTFYGAAGILDRKKVREFAAGRDFYIIPASVHETLFVPADGKGDAEPLNRMVKYVNEADVDIEDRLSDHVYFYDAETDEIRMCA